MNTRPCGLCRHLDERQLASGGAYCWARMVWSKPDDVVQECTHVERADGHPPPGRITFAGERR